jgi:LytS/YehU family sensor histidine kinase
MAVFALYIVLILAFSGLFMARLEIWLDLVEKLHHAVARKIWRNTYIDFFGFFTTMFVLGISTSSSIIQRWNREWKIRQELETQRAISELAYLRAQINPHFFFNTLNTIYSLTYSDAESSRKVLLKLSAMMRYLLYETKNDVTDVQHELDFLCNYIDIMTLRLNKRTRVHVKLPTKLTEMSIAPMLLLPFVENAFKHGVDDVRPGLINVIIEQNNNGIRLHVENDIFRSNKTEETDEHGIGLVNTRRRLDLLYPGSSELKVRENSEMGKYQVNLEITLV